MLYTDVSCKLITWEYTGLYKLHVEQNFIDMAKVGIHCEIFLIVFQRKMFKLVDWQEASVFH